MVYTKRSDRIVRSVYTEHTELCRYSVLIKVISILVDSIDVYHLSDLCHALA